jgi:DNA-binding NtrC family response regulator
MGKVYGLPNVVGKHPAMEEVYKRVRMVAPRRSSVLVVGESGTGKELIARAIHQEGPLGEGPFVPVNCAAIPDSLIEDELFGHEKGAFTDARSAREGCFEQADGGTLFLDEISELSPASQAKLLRVLQEKEFKRVGGSQPIKVRVRLIAATNKDLGAMVEESTFRQDLYYRVHVVPIHLPALRERRSDIPLLLAHFLKKTASREEIPPKKISNEAMDRLIAHEWPGNVRELENVAEQLMALTPGPEVDTEDLPSTIVAQPTSRWPVQDLVLQGQIPLTEAVSDFELSTIRRALDKCEGNKTQTAELLGLTRRVLSYKLKTLGE